MNFRTASSRDYGFVVALDHIAQEDKNRRRWIREAIEQRSLYVLTDGAAVVAYGVFRRSFFGRLFIEMLYVASNRRRNGYGETLLAALERKSIKSGEVWSSANQSNKPMRNLFLKRRFVEKGRIQGLDKSDLEIIYAKRA